MYFAILLMITASQQLPQPVPQANTANFRNLVAPSLHEGLAQQRAKLQLNNGNCAIPLLNALKDDKTTSKMPVLKPEGKYTMPIVTPVPVCGSQEK
jgi:hypothetical protein